MRSVFVSQLSARVGDRELTQFFEAQVGPVRDARVIMDRISRRSKGSVGLPSAALPSCLWLTRRLIALFAFSVGYVEFKELDSVQKALSLSGTRLLGLPIMVQYTEAERNRQATTSTPANENSGIPM